MDSIITTFHIDIKVIIAQAINFIIVFLVLYFFAIKPLKKLMAEREEKIAGGVEDAKKNAELLKNTQKEYDEILNKARTEANDIFQNGKREAEESKNKILAQTQDEVATMLANSKKILESEKVKIVEEAKKEVVSLVVKATEKLLETHTDADYEKKVLNKMKNI